jgi:hypothetical protein
MTEAFGNRVAPRHLIRDRDGVYGCEVCRQLATMGIQEVAYNDETLDELWRFNVGTALKGAPVTYSIGTRQYVAVRASGRHLHPVKFDNFQDSSYLFVFALN